MNLIRILKNLHNGFIHNKISYEIDTKDLGRAFQLSSLVSEKEHQVLLSLDRISKSSFLMVIIYSKDWKKEVHKDLLSIKQK